MMMFAVLADDEIYSSLIASSPEAQWVRITDIDEFLKINDATALFNLHKDSGDIDYTGINVPVFINSINTTLSEINAAQNILRINAWPGFIEKEIWEIAGDKTLAAEDVLKKCGKKFIYVHDEPGLASARIIALIINEAFFAKGENISSENDIDVAMKLGTNYPHGPFEWCKIIGPDNIYSLLKKLSLTEPRYIPAPELEKEINNCK